MAWRDLFVHRTRPTPAAATTAATEQSTGGAFITPQTLTSFAGASTIIGIATKVYLALAPNADGRIVAAVVALLMGVIIFIINVTDPQAKPSDGRSWFIASVVGVINILYLVAVALGVFEVLAGTDDTSAVTSGTNNQS